MTLATKNGALILKDGKLAENCGCCGLTCDFVSIDPASTISLSVASSVYGEAIFSRVYDQQESIASKPTAYTAARQFQDPQLLLSLIFARSYFARTSELISPLLSATWARLNNVGVATFCARAFPRDQTGAIVRVYFQPPPFITYRVDLTVVINGVGRDPVVTQLLDATDFAANSFFVTLPAGFLISSISIDYQLRNLIDVRTQAVPQAFLDANPVPLSEVIAYRGFYDVGGNQLMYGFADNFELP